MSRFTRRTALAAFPAAALPAAVLAGSATAHAAPDDRSDGEVRLAFLTDAHADPENEKHMASEQM